MGYRSRSRAVCDAVRYFMSEAGWPGGDEEVVGVISLVYDHTVPGTTRAMLDLEHDHEDLIVSTVHVHLTHEDCLEVIIVRGRAERVRELADSLQTIRGVKELRLMRTRVTP